jgi:tetrapyrrole methylase family protein/MazG family protein
MEDKEKMQEIERFAGIVRQLRSENGCPWDKAQTHRSLRRCLVEETGEFLDAVENDDFEGMQEELGDLLLQVVLHAQIASEAGKFTLEDVARAECEKLLRRHPHVFAGKSVSSATEALKSWEKSKVGEPGSQQKRLSAMDGVPRSMPALARAQKALSKAGKEGFEWSAAHEIIKKIEEELQEVKEALQEGDKAHLNEEIGDLLFAAVSLCRWYELEAEEALQKAVGKFMRRFRAVEAEARGQNKSLPQMSATELKEVWEKTKKQR